MPDESSFQTVLWSILLLPMLSGFLWLAAGRRVNGWAGWTAAALTLTGLLLSGWVIGQATDQVLTVGTDWLVSSGRSVPITFRVDTLTRLMLVIVHFIALLVQVYSISYLHDEPDRYRYFGFLGLFIGSMLGIVLAGNLILLYAFWELVGLSSYLLIGFWYRRPEAAAAAKKAFLMNRIGDAGFLLGIFLVIYQFGTSDLDYLTFSATRSGPLATLTGLCLFGGCIGKSAQFPLSTWLPDAMEGPTPVSALIHAATMVAAGIFLLARIHFLLTPTALTLIAFVGLTTMLLSAYAALYQTDIKRVLAYSTVSQLGLMVVGMGTGQVAAALFHLTTHAFFKAGLFLGAGSVIHGTGTQDMRRMGGLRRQMPLTFAAYAVCAAALAGVPLFSGFLSKEAILSGAFHWAEQQGPAGWPVPVLSLLASGLTACYMARQVRLVFFGSAPQSEGTTPAVHESGQLMTVPILLLAALSVGFVFSLNPFSPEHSWFTDLFVGGEPSGGQPSDGGPAHTESSQIGHGWIAAASILTVAAGLFVGYRLPEPAHPTVFTRLSTENWHLDALYNRYLVRPWVRLARYLYRFDQRLIDRIVDLTGIGGVLLAHMVSWMDRYLVDGLVNGAAWLANRLGSITRSVQNGRVQSYITSAVIGLLLILWLLI